MLDDLNFEIKVGGDSLSKALDKLNAIDKKINMMGGSMKGAATHLDKIQLELVEVSNTLNLISKISDSGLKRFFIAGAEGIRVVDLEQAKLLAGDVTQKLKTRWDTWRDTIDKAVDSVTFLNASVTQRAAEQAIDRLNSRFRQTGSDARAASTDVAGLITTSSDVRIIEPAKRLEYLGDSTRKALTSTADGFRVLDDRLRHGMSDKMLGKMADNARAVRSEALSTSKAIIRIDDAARSAADSTAMIRVKAPRTSLDAPKKPAANLGTMIQVAAITATVGGMSKIGAAVSSVQDKVRSARSTFDTFRAARLAPPVDPRFNLIGNALDTAGEKSAGVIEWFRKVADAVVSGIGNSALSGAGSLGKISAVIDRIALTTQKWNWSTRSSVGSLRLLKTVFFPLAPAFGKFETLLTSTGDKAGAFEKIMSGLAHIFGRFLEYAQQGGPILQTVARFLGPLKGMLDGLADSSESVTGKTKVLSDTANQAAMDFGVLTSAVSGAGYVLTGTFVGASGSASQFSNAMFYSLLPARLLFREFEGGKRVINAAMVAVNALTSPVRLVTNLFENSRAELRLLNKALEGKSTAAKIAAKSLFFLHTAFKPVAAAMATTYSLASKLGGGLKKLASPVTAVAKRTGGAVKNLLMFGRTSVEAGSAAANLAASVGMVGAALIGTRTAAKSASKSITNVFIKSPASLLKGLFSSRLALSALAAGAIAWGGATAIATETANTKFGTLLGSMEQGKALTAEVTKFSALTPFSNESLRESTGLLLGAQVPADQITGKLQTLGDIAAGTGKPLKDFATIFSKVSNTGKFGLEQINQLAERQVPIYSALRDTLGVSKTELMDMVSKGELGFSDMETALQSLTTGTGIFAGGMEAQSQTFAGMWSTLKDNVAIALEKVVGVFLPYGKKLMAIGISVAQGFGTAFEKIEPVIAGFAGMSQAIFMGLWTLAKSAFGVIATIGSSAFQMLGFSGETSFGGLMAGLVTFFAMAQYTFENFPLFASIAFLETSLFFTTMALDIGHFFTTTLPAYMSWFGDNWARLFLDAAAMVGTFATNIKNNIVNAWTAIWDYITGKSDALVFDWTPLTDGFRKTIDDLPEIPDRALSELELSMSADLSGMKTQFVEGMNEAVTTALDNMKPPEEIKLESTVAKQDAPVEDVPNSDPIERDNKRQAELKAVSTRSGESTSLIAQLLNRDKDGEQKKQTKHMSTAAEKLTDIERDLRNGKPIVTYAWGSG